MLTLTLYLLAAAMLVVMLYSTQPRR